MRYTLGYFGIQVRDMDRSIAFYCEVLGMELLGRSKVAETAGEIADLKSKDSAQILELNWYPEKSSHFKGPYRSGDELDHLAFACDDVTRAYKDLLSHGAKPGLPPFLEGGHWLAYVVDPDGIWIELYPRASENPQP
jgi:lactoylglutathione lyase